MNTELHFKLIGNDSRTHKESESLLKTPGGRCLFKFAGKIWG